MKFAECNEQDKISEELIRQITEEINKHTIDSLFSRYINSENYKKYRDKFDIIIMGKKTMPYNVRSFIERRINKEIEEGYLLRSYKDDYGNIVNSKISLDYIHKVTYFYEPEFDKDHVFRMHQTEYQYKMSEKPIFMNLVCQENTITIGNVSPRNA